MKTYRFGDNQVDLLCEARASRNERAKITVSSSSPFELECRVGGKAYRHRLNAGTSTFFADAGTPTGLARKTDLRRKKAPAKNPAFRASR